MKILALALAVLPSAYLAISSSGWGPDPAGAPSVRGPIMTAAQSASQDSTPDAPRKAILVTGASSGIGRCAAEHLAENGFFVYAGARKKEDLAELSELENVQGVRLDVTVPEEIAAAVETVRAGGRGLHGLINNAGVLVMAPLTEVTEEDLAFQLDVNVLGPYRVTKAFAELLIESQGRVSTTGSISGMATWSLGGPYTMSKHAVEAFTDVLAAELEPLGVRVSLVEPGNFRSEISESMVQRMRKKGYTAEGSRYEDRLKELLSRNQDRSEHKDPLPVAEAFLDAMRSETPKRRYMVTPNQREADITLEAALRRVAELNLAQAHSLDAKALHKMLDEALEKVQR